MSRLRTHNNHRRAVSRRPAYSSVRAYYIAVGWYKPVTRPLCTKSRRKILAAIRKSSFLQFQYDLLGRVARSLELSYDELMPEWRDVKVSELLAVTPGTETWA